MFTNILCKIRTAITTPTYKYINIIINFHSKPEYWTTQSNYIPRMHKVFLIAIYALVALASAGHIRQARYEPQDIYAEPNCAIVTDHLRMFRDISDPTHYWICPEGEEKAQYIQCPPNEAFMEAPQKCVVWEEWKWVEPYTK